MQPRLKARVLRVADRIQISRHYQELVADMAQLSDEWTASSAHMQKGLETGDIELLSRSILENRKQAKRMDYALRRYERIVAKLGEQS